MHVFMKNDGCVSLLQVAIFVLRGGEETQLSTHLMMNFSAAEIAEALHSTGTVTSPVQNLPPCVKATMPGDPAMPLARKMLPLSSGILPCHEKETSKLVKGNFSALRKRQPAYGSGPSIRARRPSPASNTRKTCPFSRLHT